MGLYLLGLLQGGLRGVEPLCSCERVLAVCGRLQKGLIELNLLASVSSCQMAVAEIKEV